MRTCYGHGKRERSPIVWRTVIVFGNKFVVALGRQVEGGSGNANRCQDEDGPAGSAERPGEIEMPAVPEAIVMVKEESLASVVRWCV